ncbi:MAG: TackOD1 domain-containing metal-binding protein [Candidatus Jordarchaeum sp.]|uniref:TackOD1 domain-containing metal-binding protein n=1 Tax=Candidatus Jordarchaeum sp. TaxID=2823881 RepID=UPI004048F94D
MPKGIVVVKWDNKVGPVISAKYPENIHFDMNLALKVYTTHFAGSSSPFSILDTGQWHIASYYLPRDKYLFALVLDEDESGEKYEEKLLGVAEKSSKILQERSVLDNLPEIYLELKTAGFAFKRSKLYEKSETRVLLEKFLDNSLEVLEPTFNWDEGFRYIDAEKITGLDPIDTRVLLETLSRNKILNRKSFDSAIACPNCGSYKIRVRYRCPYCASFNVQKSNFIECFLCGAVDSEELFLGIYYGEPDKYYCPKCEKELKGLGLDYRKIPAQNRCENCKKIFTEISVSVQCTECNYVVRLADAKIVEGPLYSMNPEFIHEIERQISSIKVRSAIADFFREKGWQVEAPGIIVGDNINYEFDIVASRPEIMDKDWIKNVLPGGKIALDLVEDSEEVKTEKVMGFVGKNASIAPIQYILVFIPGLSDEAKQLLGKQDIMYCEKDIEFTEIPPLIESIASIDFSELLT